MKIIRGVLGLFDNFSEKLEEEIRENERQISDACAEEQEASREPEYWRKQYLPWIRNLAVQSDFSDADWEAFGLTGAIQKIEVTLKKKALEFEDLHARLQLEMIRQKGTDQDNKKLVENLEAAIEISESSTLSLEEKETSIGKLLQEIETALPRFCIPGFTKIAKCPLVLNRIEILKAEMDGNVVDISQSDAVQDKTIADRIASEEEWKSRLADARESLKESENAVLEISDRMSLHNRKQIDFAIDQRTFEERSTKLLELEGYISNPDSNPRLQNASRERFSLEQRKIELREERVEKQKEFANQLERVQAVYNHLVKQVLSDSYTGKVELDKDGGIGFSISEGAGLTGEAIETLAVVLADVAAVKCSVSGIARHPQFLVHDSPREADLASSIYTRFLRSMKSWHDQAQTNGSAPFQYIITTTTEPPETLDEVVALRLSAHPDDKKLFRCTLGENGEQQTELPLP